MHILLDEKKSSSPKDGVYDDDGIRFVKKTRAATRFDGIEIDASFAPGIPEVDVRKYGQHHIRVLVSNIRIIEETLR